MIINSNYFFLPNVIQEGEFDDTVGTDSGKSISPYPSAFHWHFSKCFSNDFSHK